MKTSATVKEVIDFLNKLVLIDSHAIKALIEKRVPCGQGMADHPSVQVGQEGDGFCVGFLGVLNGLFGIIDEGEWAGFGPILAVYDDLSGDLVGFAEPEDFGMLEGSKGENPPSALGFVKQAGG